MHTDPISDLLTRIRNAQAVGKSEVILPYSKLKHAIAELLRQEGWLELVERLPGAKLNLRDKKSSKFKKQFAYLKIGIKYDQRRPKIKNLKRISKPGQRVYVSKDQLPYVLSNYGLAVISTSQGLMTEKQARKQGLGGEVICEVY